jgi:site-specific DNA recombinase
MLTRPTYIGRHEFNKRAKTKELKPSDQVIAVDVPPLIDRETFDAVQALLKSRHPMVKLPRFRGRLVGRDQSFSAMARASYSMGER